MSAGGHGPLSVPWRVAWLGAWAVGVSLSACRSAPAPGATNEAHVGRAQLDVTELYDLSRARDVLRTPRQVYSSTDRGLYVYPTSGPPRPSRMGLSAGLPSDDVLAVRVLPDETLVVLTREGIHTLSSGAGNRTPRDVPPPPLGELHDIEVYDGLLYACGERGLARLERWQETPEWVLLSELPGDAPSCHALVPGSTDSLWILGDATLTRLVGDELAEHRAPAFPRGHPRAVAEAANGDVFVLMEQGTGGSLARYTSGAWWSYGWGAATGSAKVVGLVAQAGVPLLVSEHAVFALEGEGRGGAELTAHATHEGRPLRFRLTPSQPHAASPLSRGAHYPRQRALSALPTETPPEPSPEALHAAPALVARALPSLGARFEGAFTSAGWVYLAAQGRGLIEVGESRRPLSAGDFREARPLAVAVDERHGTWVRADDGTLVRIADGVARIYPHGRVSALLESQDASGGTRRQEVWAALVGAGGETVLAVPAPSGWVERVRLPADAGFRDVRLGLRAEGEHLWLFAHGQRPEWAHGSGLAYRGPSSEWAFVGVPLEPRGALEAVTHLVAVAGVAFAAGPDGLARVAADGSAQRVFDQPVSDVERRGDDVLFVSNGHLWALSASAPLGTRPRSLHFDEEPSEALRRVNPAGLAVGRSAACVVGAGGFVVGPLDPVLPGLPPAQRWRPVERAGPALVAHDVEMGDADTWVARRDGALVLLAPAGP